uniref:Uncharacterized protein MANES_01G239700 n=1 Tax=Rhizophora mucronata TaxID=61149 RepID=A0A2P2K2Y8_RHIMU
MATVQLGFSNIFAPVGNKFAAVAATAVTSIPSLSLRPPPHQFRFPKFCSRKALVSSSVRRLSNPRLRRGFMISAYVDADPVVSQEINGSENGDGNGSGNGNDDDDEELGGEVMKQPGPYELYVCNLPRSCEIYNLVRLFAPFGTVISAEISRNPDTGVSRGCGYVTMGSLRSARYAVATLDGSVEFETGHHFFLICLCTPFS